MNYSRCLRPGPFLALLALSFAGTVRAQYTNGIYAEFNTSMGSFTSRLEYATAPRTVANFIGLATGERAWLDLTIGLARTNPFYNGLTFHRVVENFVIQAGSPNGQGTDGPGYQFTDEFHPGLRHNQFGILSMANNGPDSNGSQFFVTAANTPFLDDKHSVFGRLFGGSNVVYAISRVATNTASKPLTDVVIQSVTIRRVGAEAAAFDIHAQGLPVVSNVPSALANTGTNYTFTFSNKLNVDNRLYTSTNLFQWSVIPLGLVVGQLPPTLSINPVGPARFFRMAQVQFPQTLFVPPNVLGRTITFNFTGGGVLVVAFDNSGGGTCTFDGSPAGSVFLYSYTQDAYRGRLRPIVFTLLPAMNLHLDFDSANAGTFKGETSTGNVAGTFTVAP